MKKTIFGVCSLLFLIIGLSCTALSYKITPAKLDRKAKEYVVTNGTAEPNEYKGYQSLEKLMRLEKDVDITYDAILFALNQEKEQQDFDYARFKETITRDVETAKQTEQLLFDEQKGIFSLGLSLLGVGGLSGLLGLMRKRPGDVTPTEMEQTLADATGRTQEELSTKEKQFIQLVKGVQKFIDLQNGSNPETVAALKVALRAEQDADTRQAVAVVKAS